ncbi:hypothetical protein [Methylobacterium frigidaeris]|uniref:hypothetical protein n=1 Tax=Methylobacterium frigidaeris TaxID=2038277 RepID=UPI001EDEC0D5|nr:hypothetical protein [Methylobacterium frigidaeris]
MGPAPEGRGGAPEDVMDVNVPADAPLAPRGPEGIPQGIDDGGVELAGIWGAGIP